MSARRFPIGLTIATAISLAILCWLGTWQLQRMAWKTDLLARIEAARTSAPISIDELLKLKAAGQPIEWRRVALTCASEPPPPKAGAEPTREQHGLVYALDDGKVAWRVFSPCRPVEHPDMTVVLDRGFSWKLADVIQPTQIDAPMPAAAVGLVRLVEPPRTQWVPLAPPPAIPGGFYTQYRDQALIDRLGSGRAPSLSDIYISVESETPQPGELRPVASPPEIPNRHLEYALTWFGLAATLLAIYAAMLWRRFKAPKAQ